MMNLKKITPQKNRAQAMVEFAIALPILLMLLYGLLEAGRLLFLYSTIVTATRQAVRYGSTTGDGSTPGVPRYRDCAGIRGAAERVDFLNAFDHTGADIEIMYDTGPGTTQYPYCPDLAPDTSFSPSNSNRIYVNIKGDFFPIIPRLVPFIERSVANGDPIQAASARTILVSISIEVTNTPDLSPSSPTSPPTATATSTEIPTDTPTATATITPIFSETPSLTPTITLSPTFTLTPAPSMTPTITNTPTITPSPTISPTPVPNCNSTNLRAGQISKSGSSMSLTVTNLLTTPIQVQDIFVVWNHNNGHQGTTDKTLRLISVAWEPPIWTGNSASGSQSIIPSPTTYAEPGSSTLTFTFHQTYDNWEKKNEDLPERILISFSTPGCTSLTIDVQHTPQ